MLDNTVDSNDVGIDSQGALVEGNVANQNSVGIDAQAAGRLWTGNTANGNTGIGILAVAADGGQRDRGTAANDNSAEGIIANGNGQPSILGNTANGNKQQGIVIGSRGRARPPQPSSAIRQNVSNGEDGIDIEAADLTFSGNIANDNAGDGFNFNSGTTVSIASNTADGNSDTGFVILAATGTVSKNTADFNKGTTAPRGGFL